MAACKKCNKPFIEAKIPSCCRSVGLFHASYKNKYSETPNCANINATEDRLSAKKEVISGLNLKNI